MEKYSITGMSCAACQARVEKAVLGVEGVKSCSVNLLTNSMGVEGDASAEKIIKAVENAGYGAAVSSNDIRSNVSSNSYAAEEEALRDKETPKLRKRLIASIIFLLILMYFSMGHMMLGWPIPKSMSGNHVAMGLLQMILAVIIMVINQKFFISGFKSLIKGAPNMDTLVALGSFTSFIYSVGVLFIMTDSVVKGGTGEKYMDEFYFESAAMILTLITVGKMLEAYSKGKTTNALKSLMKLAPKTAVIYKDGKEKAVSIDEVKVGNIFVVRSGESIPVDGVVIEGNCAVNEAALTGESIPVDKTEGDEISAATICASGYIKGEARRVGRDTTLSQIIEMVSDAAATKAPIAKIADKVSGIFVPVVIAISVVTFIIWMLLGYGSAFSISRAISVLVITCPCALGLATPVAIMVGNGVGARNGILFKNAVSLEETGRAKAVVFDKTGTITSGEPVVTDIYGAEGFSNDDILRYAVSLEKLSEHPLAKAIVKYSEATGEAGLEVKDFKVYPGNGLSGMIEGKRVAGGNFDFINKKIKISKKVEELSAEYASEGKTPIFFSIDEKLLGIVAVADTLKNDSIEAIKMLKKMNIGVIMLTGDNKRTAEAVGKAAGVDIVISDVLPSGKEKAIRELKEEYGKVIMVGDGINDAPALTAADIGIAIGAGTDVAIDAADVVLMKSKVKDVVSSIILSKATLRNIHQNLFWAFIYNVIGIPLAAGAYYHLWGIKLSPMFGALAMSLSSFCVVTNALRLNLIKLPKDENISDNNSNKTAVVKIGGMMCEHCEKRVRDALTAFTAVENAEVSHKTGKAILTVSEELNSEDVKKAVTEAGYKFKGLIYKS